MIGSIHYSRLEFDIFRFKAMMAEAPSLENGWSFEYEGAIDKNFHGIDW